jgi:hypothetical protein
MHLVSRTPNPAMNCRRGRDELISRTMRGLYLPTSPIARKSKIIGFQKRENIPAA